MDIFIIKKLIGSMVSPLPVSILLIVWGMVLFWRDHKTKGTLLSMSGILCLCLFSTPWLPQYLLQPVEQKYHQYDLSQPVSHVVVLGCGHINDGSLPVTAQLNGCAVKRLLEGIRIYRQNPGSHIITSGYGGNEPFSNAEMMKRLAVTLGIPANRIITSDNAKDTRQEAKDLYQTLKGPNFALVTSASHMPRAMGIFEDAGLHPLAAPTDHIIRDESRHPWWKKLPSSRHLVKSERLWYETLGQWWVQFRAWLKTES